MRPTMMAAAVAVLALAGCGTAAHSAAAGPPPQAAASPSPQVAAATPAATCKQQAAQWKAANKATIRKFKNSLTPFASGTVTSAQARALSSAAQAMVAAPLPQCADPKGYYGQAMANLVTAGTAASGGGLLSEVGALGPMENAETLLTELSAELRQSTGLSKL